MTKKSHYQGRRLIVSEFHAEVPAYKAPVIESSKKIGGVKHYVDVDGKLYKADLFDAMFKVNKTKMLGRSFKGLNPHVKLRR